MNVEYQCEVCGNRIFAPPGGTKLHCRHHQEAAMVQTEETTAPDYLWVEEDGKTRSKDIIRKDGDGNNTIRMRPEPTIDRNAPGNPMIELELETWRMRYLDITGLSPDMRWGAPRLQEEIVHYQHENENPQANEGQPEEPEEPRLTVVPDDVNEEEAQITPPPTEGVEGVVVSEIPDEEEGDN